MVVGASSTTTDTTNGMPHKHAISAYYVIETYCYVSQMMLELSSIALNLSLILDVLAGGPSSAIKVHSDDHRPDCVAAEVVENEPPTQQ